MKKQSVKKGYHDKSKSVKQYGQEKNLMNGTSEITYQKVKYQKSPKVQLVYKKCKYVELPGMKMDY